MALDSHSLCHGSDSWHDTLESCSQLCICYVYQTVLFGYSRHEALTGKVTMDLALNSGSLPPGSSLTSPVGCIRYCGELRNHMLLWDMGLLFFFWCIMQYLCFI